MLRRLLTFPDARGQRWSIFRPNITSLRLMSWRRRWLLLSFTFLLPLWLFLFGALLEARLLMAMSPGVRSSYLAVAFGGGAQFAGILVGTLVLAHLVGSRLSAAHASGYILKRGHCPTCAYSLANLPPTDPITCPECGAAWHPVPSKPAIAE